MRRIKVGVIGCGQIAQYAHIPNYIQNPKSKLVAICDVNKEHLTSTAKKYGVEHAFEDYEEMLDSKLVEAVSICVPTKFHANVVIAAATRKIHVLCEKPLASTLDEADQMLETISRSKIKFAVGFNLRYLPNHQKVKEYIANGKIGKLIFARAQLVTTGPYAANSDSYASETQKRIGCLFDSGAHIADLMMWLFGKPVSVSACLSTYMEGVKVDDAALVLMKFKSGLLGEISVAWVPISHYDALKNSRQIQVIGTKGVIESDIFGPSFTFYSVNSLSCKIKGKITLTPKKFDPMIPNEALNYSYKKEIDTFLDSIGTHKPPGVTGEEARESLRLILAAYESHKSGSPISLN